MGSSQSFHKLVLGGEGTVPGLRDKYSLLTPRAGSKEDPQNVHDFRGYIIFTYFNHLFIVTALLRVASVANTVVTLFLRNYGGGDCCYNKGWFCQARLLTLYVFF